MRAFYRQAQPLSQRLCTPGVIDVCVGEEDFREVHTLVGDGRQNVLEVTTRVDDGTLEGFCRPDDGAVLLKGGHGDDGRAEGHGVMMLGYTPAGQRVNPRLTPVSSRREAGPINSGLIT